jgi:septal ring factor EnvC (AmiA/AmiB activator)
MVPDRAEAMRRLRVYHASVDTESRAMNDSPEDLLADARAQVETLRRDHAAQGDLLTEASANLDSLRGEVATLTADLETVRTERDSANAEITTLQTRITELQSAQADFDTRVQTEVARVVASTGTMVPARVTAAGDTGVMPVNSTLQELVAQYDRLVSTNKPDEAAQFYQNHLSTHFNR